MKGLLAKSILGASLLLPSMMARAQYLGDQTYSESRTHTLFDRVRSDLDRAEVNRAEVNADPTRGEADRFDIAQQRLNAFQRAWRTGQDDYRDLDDLIAAVQGVVSTNHLIFRDERNLRDDLNIIRDLVRQEVRKMFALTN